jgi:predicted anti-sigma-YlaC factor YlaD
MDCRAYQEAISARIDDEETGLEAEAVESHLRTCHACRSWAEKATAVTRSARVGSAEPVPDLTAPIMAAAAARSRREPNAPSSTSSPTLVARLGLIMVAGAQLYLAIPALLGHDPGASIHIAHEQGSWALALAVGFLVVVVRPARAAAMLPLVAALTAGLALTMAVDISAGRTQAAAEAPHGLAFLGLGLLWLLSRGIRPAGALRRPARPAAATATSL